jgi:hypothetical protein
MLPLPAMAELPTAGSTAPGQVPRGVRPVGDPWQAGRWRGGPASARAASMGWEAAVQPAAPPAAVAAGGCHAWPLSLDATCASEARSVFREAVGGLASAGEWLDDGVTMASELAANTLHAHNNVEFDGAGRWPQAGAPELWVYLRHRGGRWELVCKVFDSLGGWKDRPAPGRADTWAASGRGLAVVAGLSGGRWGHHLTRSRLGGWKVPGKAVWFSVPISVRVVPAELRLARLAPGQAAAALEAMLRDRGLGNSMLRVEEPAAGMSVLSVRPGLTVWCRDDKVWWRARDGRYEYRAPTDLVEITEQVVAASEEIRAGIGAGQTRLDRVP